MTVCLHNMDHFACMGDCEVCQWVEFTVRGERHAVGVNRCEHILNRAFSKVRDTIWVIEDALGIECIQYRDAEAFLQRFSWQFKEIDVYETLAAIPPVYQSDWPGGRKHWFDSRDIHCLVDQSMTCEVCGQILNDDWCWSNVPGWSCAAEVNGNILVCDFGSREKPNYREQCWWAATSKVLTDQRRKQKELEPWQKAKSQMKQVRNQLRELLQGHSTSQRAASKRARSSAS